MAFSAEDDTDCFTAISVETRTDAGIELIDSQYTTDARATSC